ncbi:hypothetical protein NMY22_g15908 [Coprinellus aureogranulatus]|nr:hypothetical protein NMY22_g15908 [Coprinellus aureogranulatus]
MQSVLKPSIDPLSWAGEMAQDVVHRLQLAQTPDVSPTPSPIQHLPNEILQEIFAECLSNKQLPTLAPNEAPLLLARVSKAWRNLAFSTPQLWASIHIPLPMGTHQTDELISRISACFDAAQDKPMEVSLWSPAWTGLLYGHPVTECITSHSFHIRILVLNVSTQVLAQFYPSDFKIAPEGGDNEREGSEELSTSVADLGGFWPVLEKVTLDFRTPSDDWGQLFRGENVFKASFWLAPRLKRVKLISVDVYLFKLPLRWGQLEEVDVSAIGPHDYPDQLPLHSFTPREAKHLLLKCGDLSSLSIVMSSRVHEHRTLQTPASLPLVHSKLTELFLEDVAVDPTNHPVNFLQDLQLPALKTLSYYLTPPEGFDRDRFPHTFDNPLLCFLKAQEKPCPITTFTSASRSMSFRGLVECLKLMPALENLHLSAGWYFGLEFERDWDDEFLGMFLPSGLRSQFGRGSRICEDEGGHRHEAGHHTSDPPLILPEEGLCPRLHDFIFGESTFTPDGIFQFVTSRISLSQEPNATFARPKRFYALLEEVRPDFVARDARGGTNQQEEELWGFGVDAKIKMQKPFIPQERHTTYKVGDGEKKETPVEPKYDPKRGLPRWYGGYAERWIRSHDRC